MQATVRSTQFRRDVKRAGARGKNLGKLREILVQLIQESPLPTRYRDHRLRGIWQGQRNSQSWPVANLSGAAPFLPQLAGFYQRF
ncbi:MAG: type II toxin-antitoxin system YafQ family toxin [Candidatus Latescibacteria bacterium]|nr:type II toxin-antitoxin system YafQ family toxin [Candidatus Latescibacterota bacterium]